MDEQLNIDFQFNTPDAKRDLKEIEGAAQAVNDAAEKGNKPLKDREGIVERLKRRMGELRAESDKATSISGIAQYNKELQKYEQELLRLSRAGRAGFDSHGQAMISNTSILQRLQQQAALWQRGMNEATNPAALEKYSQKLALVNAEMSKFTKTNVGGAGQWNGLQNSINQLSRELPAFTYSVQTGLMAMANNFPIFTDEVNRLRAANAALHAEGKKGTPVWKQLASSLFSWQTLMMVGITLMTVYGKEIGQFFVELFKGKQAINQAKRDFEALNGVMSDSAKQAAKEITQLKVLSTVAQDVTKSTKERKEAAKQLQELGKSHNIQLQTEAILAGNAAAQYRELAKSILEAARSKAAQSKIEENEAKRLDLEFKRQKVQNANASEKSRYVKEGATTIITSSANGAISNNQTISVADKQKGSDTRAKAAIAEINAEMNVLDKTSDFLMKYVKVQAEVEKVKNTGGAKAENLYKQLIDSRKEVLQKIFDLDNEYRIKSYTEDEKEREALKQKFADFRKIIEEENEKIAAYNKKNNKNVGLIDIDQIAPIEKRATEDLIYRQSTENFIKELNIQKDLYTEYEQYKSQTSSAEADKRFAADLSKIKSYYNNITGEINSLQGKQFESELTGGESERLNKLLEILKEFNRTKQAEEDKIFIQSLQLTKTRQEKIAEVNEKYEKLFLAQEKDLTDEKKDLLIRGKQEEIDQINQTEAQKNKILIEAAKRQLIITTASIRAQIAVIKDLLAREDLDPKFRQELEASLEKAQSTAKLGARAASVLNLKKQYRSLTDELVKLKKAGASAQDIELINNKISETTDQINNLNEEGLQELFQLLQRVSQSVGQLGEAFSNLGDAYGNNFLSSAGGFLSGLASGIDNLSVAFDKSAKPAEKYAAAVGAAVDMISMVANAAAERKRAEEEYYRAMIDMQREYNLAINDQLRLQSQLSESVYVKDYVGRMKDGMLAAEDAIKNYQKAVSELAEKGKVSVGLKNAVDWKNVGSGAVAGAVIGGVAAGALAGAVAGSVVPVIGTVIGAAVGAIIGIFAGKKKKPKYEDLWTKMPPEIAEVLTSSDAQDIKDVKVLLESINNDKAVDANTKQMIEGVLEWIAKIEEARAQIKEVVQELSGSLGNEMRNNLVEYFKQGEDAAKAMGKTVEKILEDMLSQLLFSNAFDALFKDFEDELTDTLLFGDENDIISLFADFLNDAETAGQDFYKWMDMAKQAADKEGLKIFQPTNGNSSSLTSTGIEKMSQDQATQMDGYLRSSNDLHRQEVMISEKALVFHERVYLLTIQSLKHQAAIEFNTAETVRVLSEVVTPILKNVKDNTGTIVERI